MINSGTEDLLLHIVQFWRACTVTEENRDPPMVIYCSHMTHRDYSRLGLPPIKKQGRKINSQQNINS